MHKAKAKKLTEIILDTSQQDIILSLRHCKLLSPRKKSFDVTSKVPLYQFAKSQVETLVSGSVWGHLLCWENTFHFISPSLQ